MRIGFVGGGVMAEAMIGGILDAGSGPARGRQAWASPSMPAGTAPGRQVRRVGQHR